MIPQIDGNDTDFSDEDEPDATGGESQSHLENDPSQFEAVTQDSGTHHGNKRLQVN